MHQAWLDLEVRAEKDQVKLKRDIPEESYFDDDLSLLVVVSSRLTELGFEIDSLYLPKVVKPRWGYRYDIALYGRLGLHCHNLHKGTNFKFRRWEKYCAMTMAAYVDFYLTATDPATGSVFSLQTLLSDIGRRPAAHGNEPPDRHWNDDKIDDFYKGPNVQCSNGFLTVQESELRENDWLQLLLEIAFFSKANRRLRASLPLEMKKVVVENREEYTTEAREKLKADNAIFNALGWLSRSHYKPSLR
ncbi:unnamed protein product [Thlaspi arvense]|uniref:Uncharacterized protein n=1 Tax=Thlaspi arvense TaxID=13288 RepID=A0AAU9T4K5_THLAR|nr:unnamed protein product [Thlaspi arvense]